MMNSERKKVLVCSAGGAHTTSYIGFWKYVFDERGYRPDSIVGTSGGALFGCFMAAGLKSEDMRNALHLYKPWKFFRVAPFRWIFDFMLYWGLIRIKDIHQLLKDILNHYDIDWNSFSKTKFQCVVTDLSDGTRKYIPQDMDLPLATAVTASIAIPGVFEPVWVSGDDGRRHCLVDGGVCEGYPVKAALKMGRERIKILAISPFDLTEKRRYEFSKKMRYGRMIYRTLLDAKGEDMIELLDESLGDCYLPTGFVSNHVIDFDKDVIEKNIQIGYEQTKNARVNIDGFFLNK
jgi:predicted acylesterase/phospholipase RssA